MAREERNYAHRSLFDKLGVRPEHRVCCAHGVDEAFIADLAEVLDRPPSRTARGNFDAIFMHVNVAADLDAIRRLATRLKPAGALWIFHPKGRGASPTDGEVRQAGIAAGLVDNKISAYTDTHTATRYVVPKAKRPNG